MGGKHWTEKENTILKDEYGKISLKELEKLLPGRSVNSICTQANKLGLTNNKNVEWLPEEDDIVRKHYYTEKLEDLAKRLPRHTLESVRARPYYLGLAKKFASTVWKEEETEILIIHYPNESVSELAKRLPGRSIESIIGKIRQLGLRKKDEDVKPYAQEELDYLVEHYGKESILEIAKKLKDRTYHSIVCKAHALGLSEKNSWTEEEDNVLREFYPTETAEKVAKRLTNRTAAAVRIRARHLGINKISKASKDDEIDDLQKSHQIEIEKLNEQHDKEIEELNAAHQEEIDALMQDLEETKRKKKTKRQHRKKKNKSGDIWTEEEDSVLRENFNRETLSGLAIKLPNHSPKSIQERAKKLGIIVDKSLEKWKPEEIEILRQYYPIEGTAVFYRLKRFSLNSIKFAAKRLKVKSNRITEPWTFKEDLLACKYYLEHINDWNEKEIIDGLLDIFISNNYLKHGRKTIHMKLANCSYIHTGIGLEHASIQNIKVYNKLTGNNWFKRLWKKIKNFFKHIFG